MSAPRTTPARSRTRTKSTSSASAASRTPSTRISIRRSAPDWLPFIPGSSYWVPPRRRTVGVLEVVRKLANPLTEEETMSLTNIRWWPSSAYFVEGIFPHSVKKNPKEASAESDDEE